MTAQCPEHLQNHCEAVDFGELALYRVVTGDIESNHGWGTPYPFRNPPSEPIPSSAPSCLRFDTALHRRYTAEYELANDGTITLVAYRYPLTDGEPRVEVREHLVGDFWLVMKSWFYGERVYVPFRSGSIVTDEKCWIVEGAKSLDTLKYPEQLFAHLERYLERNGRG